MDVETNSNVHLDFEDISVSVEAVVEEIEEDEGITLTLGRPPLSPVKVEEPEEPEIIATSPEKVRRDFGNISPISELLDDDDLEIVPHEEMNEEEEAAGKVTPEPGLHPIRNSLPNRISDGRSSPILAFSPSLVKSPSSVKSTIRLSTSSPSSSGGKKPRNITRMLDNISDHSSGEDDVNSVGMMMAKFSV